VTSGRSAWRPAPNTSIPKSRENSCAIKHGSRKPLRNAAVPRQRSCDENPRLHDNLPDEPIPYANDTRASSKRVDSVGHLVGCDVGSGLRMWRPERSRRGRWTSRRSERRGARRSEWWW
jgi:hypothetical protein